MCNHPELFEGQAERWPLQFSPLTTAIDDALKPAPQEVKAGPGRPPKAPAASMYIQVTGFKSHIQVVLPRLLYSEGLLGLPSYTLGGHLQYLATTWLQQNLLIWQAANTHSLAQQQQGQGQPVKLSGGMNGGQQQQQQLHQQQQAAAAVAAAPSSNGNHTGDTHRSNGGSSGGSVLVLAAEPCCSPGGLGFTSLCGLSPGEVWAAAVGDPFQVWEVTSSSSEGAAAAAAAWQQCWQQYDLSEQQWREEVGQLRRQLQQQQLQEQQDSFAAAVAAAAAAVAELEAKAADGLNHHHHNRQQQQQQGVWCPGGLGRLQEVHSTQHSAAQQTLLSLPPSQAALLGGRSRRTSRLLLLVDDIAAGHSSGGGCSERGRGLRRQRSVWSDTDRQMLLQLQQQQGQDPQGLQQQQELGQLLPPLVLSSSSRLDSMTDLLRSVWGALIPPVLSPGVQLSCSSSGVVRQQRALVAAHWARALLLGIDSTPDPPRFPAGAPPLLAAAAAWRVTAVTAAVQPPLQPSLPAAAAAAAAGGGDSTDEEGEAAGGAGGRESEEGGDGDESAVNGQHPRLGFAYGSPGGFSAKGGRALLNPSSDVRATPPLPPKAGRGRGRGRRGRGRGRGRWANRASADSAAGTPSSSRMGDGEGAGEEGGDAGGASVQQQRRQYCYVVSRQQAALPGYCRDVPPPLTDLDGGRTEADAAVAAAAAGGGVSGATADATAVADAVAFAAAFGGAVSAPEQQQQYVSSTKAASVSPSPAAAAAIEVPPGGLPGATPPKGHTPTPTSTSSTTPGSFPLVVLTQQPPCGTSLPPAPPSMQHPPLQRDAFAAVAQQGLASPLFRVFGSAPPSQPYALAKALADSGKLMALDGLLGRLKGEGHRCLIFCQVGGGGGCRQGKRCRERWRCGRQIRWGLCMHVASWMGLTPECLYQVS